MENHFSYNHGYLIQDTQQTTTKEGMRCEARAEQKEQEQKHQTLESQLHQICVRKETAQ